MGKNENWHLLLSHCRYFDKTFTELHYGMPNVALFDIFIFLSDLTSLLLYILGFVFNIWPFLFYMFRFYSIFYDLNSIYPFIFIV